MTGATTSHPMTPAQRRLWFLHTLDPDDTAYTVHLVQLLRGPLRPELFEPALREVARRHAILRSTCDERGDGPVQLVAAESTVSCAWSDLSGADRPGLRARTAAAALVALPFDLRRDQPLRASLARTGPDTHVFCLVTHHIAADGWSANILLDEISAAYRALRDGAGESARPLPTLQFGDYAEQRRTWAGSGSGSGSGSVEDAAFAYWSDRLAAAPQLELPTDRPRPPVRTGRGGRVTATVPAELAARLGALARRHRATPVVPLLAAYQVLLTAHSGQDEVCVGMPMAGRDRPELQDLVGYLANTVVLRGSTAGDGTVAELLAATRRSLVEAMTHQELPFERLSAELRVSRDRSRTPLFQAFFSLQNQDDPRSAWRAAGIAAEPFDIGPVRVKYELGLDLWPEPDGSLRAEFGYDADLFDAVSVEAVAGRYLVLLDAFAADQDRAVRELPVLAPGERERITAMATGPAVPVPELSVPDLFLRARDLAPDAVAVVDHGAEVTYRQLGDRAAAVAERLVRRGVRPGELVAVCLNRSADLIATLFGIWGAGAGYVPLDPSYPAHRLALVAEDSGAVLTVSERALLDRLPSACAQTLLLDEVGPGPEGPPEPPRAVSDHSAYVIYTSGSTGRPKGVGVSHRNIVNFLEGMARCLPEAVGSTLALTSLSFDISVLEMFLPLSRGGRVVVADETARRDGARLLRLVREHRISLVQATPTTWRMLLAAGFDEPDVTALSGGEPLPLRLAAELRAACGRLANVYGPTETTVWSSLWDVPEQPTVIGIGTALANQSLHVLDRHGRLAPLGVPGELFIGGAGVTAGYRGNPELTAERFVADPFGGGVMYRSGDLVLRRHDGTVVFLGRTDNQVKIRGHRIELGEIEVRLAGHPAVDTAAVAVRPDPSGAPALAGYAVLRPDGPGATPGELRAYLERELPAALVPGTVTLLDAMPTTPNRKLDRAALPDPVPPPERSGGGAFAGPEEESVGKLCGAVLGVADLGPEDDLFDLGAHSLSVMEIIAAVRAEWRVELPVEVFFETPTVRAVAALVREAAAGSLR